MPAPQPYDGHSGVFDDPAERLAPALHAQYKWLFRWSDEMDSDTDLDLKKLAQFTGHCRAFRQIYQEILTLSAEESDAVDGFFAFKQCRWPSRAAMKADLDALSAACLTAADWIDANMPEIRTGFATLRLTAGGRHVDDSIKIAKSAGVATKVAQFRALFA